MEFHLDCLKEDLQKFLDHYEDDLHKTHLETITSALKQLKLVEFKTDLPLLVLDLNGVMIETEFVPDMKVEREGWIRVGKSLRRALPSATQFFEWYQKHQAVVRVAIWSSSYLSNVEKTIQGLFPVVVESLAFVWGQEQCESAPNPDYNSEDKKSKPVFFWKNLSKIVQDFPQYQPGKMLIIDDSEQKLEKNPPENVLVLGEGEDPLTLLLKSAFARLHLKECS